MMTNLGQPEINSYLLPLIDAFKASADSVHADRMSAYMKNNFPFFGISSPHRKELMREFLKEYSYPQPTLFPDVIVSCFQQHERELQYFAVDILTKKIDKQNKETIELAEWMIVTKSWWDSVDAIASNIIGPLLLKFPELRNRSDGYLKSDNMWLRRTALLHQLKYKDQTDEEKLFAYCQELSDEKGFFIRKAIGWALREYSKTDPKSVINFVNKIQISALSRKEALKWLNNKS
ncbi:MAG: DNA alkylation repair protein [Chitinophagales bacterium]|nr:DNA alkylation repair protein [Chitinophagales bacterium]